MIVQHLERGIPDYQIRWTHRVLYKLAHSELETGKTLQREKKEKEDERTRRRENSRTKKEDRRYRIDSKDSLCSDWPLLELR